MIFLLKNDIKKLLLVDNIDEVFERFSQFLYMQPTNAEEAKQEMLEIMKEFGIQPKSRMFTNCAMVLNCSRVFNKRKAFNIVDYNRLRRYIWSINRALTIEDVESSKTIPKAREVNKDILNSIMDEVGDTVPEDEFD